MAASEDTGDTASAAGLLGQQAEGSAGWVERRQEEVEKEEV